jgi:hypothetical protein
LACLSFWLICAKCCFIVATWLHFFCALLFILYMLRLSSYSLYISAILLTCFVSLQIFSLFLRFKYISVNSIFMYHMCASSVHFVSKFNYLWCLTVTERCWLRTTYFDMLIGSYIKC